MSAILDQAHKLLTLLENEEHTLVSDFRAIYDKLRGEATADAAQVEYDAVAAGEAVAHDAQAAMGPVLAEAEKDAVALGSEATTDAAQAVTDAAPPAAS